MIKFIAGVFARLPLPFVHWLGAKLGRLIFACSPSYQRRLRDNLQTSGLKLESLGRANAAELGKAIFELPYIWLRPTKDLLDTVASRQGWDAVLAAKAEGKGLIMLTPHLGSFEFIGAYLASQFPITILYRPPKLSWLEPLMRVGRSRDHAALATTDMRGVRALLKALKRGEALGILPDQAPGAGDGVWANFFGRPAYTMTMIKRLQERSGAPVITMYAERLSKNNGFSLHFYRFNEPLANDDMRAATQINEAMETLIRQCPTQYLWSYNRYKVPAGAHMATNIRTAQK